MIVYFRLSAPDTRIDDLITVSQNSFHKSKISIPLWTLIEQFVEGIQLFIEEVLCIRFATPYWTLLELSVKFMSPIGLPYSEH